MSKTKRGGKAYSSPHDSDKELKKQYNRRMRRVNKKNKMHEDDLFMKKDEAVNTYDLKPNM